MQRKASIVECKQRGLNMTEDNAYRRWNERHSCWYIAEQSGDGRETNPLDLTRQRHNQYGPVRAGRPTERSTPLLTPPASRQSDTTPARLHRTHCPRHASGPWLSTGDMAPHRRLD